MLIAIFHQSIYFPYIMYISNFCKTKAQAWLNFNQHPLRKKGRITGTD